MGLQPGMTYSISVESTEVERVLPGEKLITLEAKADITDIRFSAIPKGSAVSITGAAFFEGEETVKVHRTLYKELPKISVSLYEIVSDERARSPVKVLD